MALNLSGLFHTNVSDTRVDSSPPRAETGASGGREQAAVQTGRLEPGQTVNGEIVGRSGDEIQIRIAKDVVLNARMEQAIQASVGQQVTFEVRSQSSGVFNLRPLFQNMSQESTALQALTQAGIEVNGKSMQMVFAMMSEGMSIGKESVQDMYQQVLDLPEADVTSIVQLNRLGIPVTFENLQQFAAYKNYEHQLLSSFSQVADEIPQAVTDIFATGLPEEGNAFISRLLTIFAGEGGEALAGEPEAVENNTAVLEDIVITQEGSEENEAASNVLNQMGEDHAVDAETVPAGQKMVFLAEEQTGKEPVGSSTDQVVSGDVTEAGSLAEAEENAIPGEDRAKLAALVKNAGGSQETVRQLQQGQLGKDELYKIVSELSRHAQTPESQEAVKDLFVSKAFQKVFQEKIANQWTLTTPESVEKKEVAKLYERLNEQTRQLTQALSDAVKADSPLFKSVQNIRENVDFMNQMNQMYAYVQLPLKWKGENAHGDLYVYTNKKNLAGKDGNVSAFLHLDMQLLGMVDVYVAMERGKISTNFYLVDEKALELLEKNMDMLTKRLTEKGYQAQAKVMLKEEADNVMEEIIKTDRNISIVSELSFDVRA